jgi:hypothetical protein
MNYFDDATGIIKMALPVESLFSLSHLWVIFIFGR